MTGAWSSTAGPPTATSDPPPSSQRPYPTARVVPETRLRVGQRGHRVADADLAAGEDVRPYPAAMDETSQNPGRSEALQVRTRLREAATDAFDAPDPEALPHEGVQADAARDDVSACLFPGDLD